MATALGTAVGRPLGRALGNTQTLFEEVLALAAGRPVFTADYYALDPVTGKVAAFIDWNDPTHMLVQSTSANQCAAPGTIAGVMAGSTVATFASNLTYYRSNRPTASWDFCSNGAGFRIFYALRRLSGGSANALVGCTNNASSPTTGYDFNWVNTITGTCYIRTLASTSVGSSANPALDSDGWVSHEVVGSPTANIGAWAKGTKTLTTTKSVAGGAAVGPFTLNDHAATPNVNFRGSLYFRAVVFTPPNLSAADESIAHRWLTATTGVAP